MIEEGSRISFENTQPAVSFPSTREHQRMFGGWGEGKSWYNLLFTWTDFNSIGNLATLAPTRHPTFPDVCRGGNDVDPQRHEISFERDSILRETTGKKTRAEPKGWAAGNQPSLSLFFYRFRPLSLLDIYIYTSPPPPPPPRFIETKGSELIRDDGIREIKLSWIDVKEK